MLFRSGLAYSVSGDQTAAIADFTKALTLKPDYPEALLGRAAAYHMAGQNALASADLAAAEKLPLDDTLSATLGVLRQQVGTP